jgi:hypothetical protein
VSRPDVAYSVGILSQFVQNPGQVHWEALKCVIVYLKCTKDLWLTFGGHIKTLVEGYCDADWAGQKHQHSISGYSFHMGKGAISQSSKKQYIIALLSTEAEYIAQTHVAKEALWLHSFLKEICGLLDVPLTINCNNQGAITLSKDNKFHTCTKHIDIWYHFIRKVVEDKKIEVRRLKSYTYLWMIMCPISSPNHLQKKSSVALLSYLDSVQLLSSEHVTMTSYFWVLVPGQAVIDTKMTSFHSISIFIMYTRSLKGECWGYTSIAHILNISYFFISFFTWTSLHNILKWTIEYHTLHEPQDTECLWHPLCVMHPALCNCEYPKPQQGSCWHPQVCKSGLPPLSLWLVLWCPGQTVSKWITKRCCSWP